MPSIREKTLDWLGAAGPARAVGSCTPDMAVPPRFGESR